MPASLRFAALTASILLLGAFSAAPTVAQEPCATRTECENQGLSYPNANPEIVFEKWPDTVTVASQRAVVLYSDDDGLDVATHQYSLNGGAMETGWLAFVKFYTAARMDPLLTLVPGSNTVSTTICDKTGRCSTETMSTVYAPPPPPAVTRVAPTLRSVPVSGNRNLATCDGCSEAVAAYTTPAYGSRDMERSVTLLYASSQADPRGFVELEAVDPSSGPADYMSIQVRTLANTLLPLDGSNSSNTLYFRSGAGANRVAASFPLTGYQTGLWAFLVTVTSHWNDGTQQSSSLEVRVPIVNERQGWAGIGWSVAGLERLHVQAGPSGPVGLLLTDGAGGVLWFDSNSCSGSGSCPYTSSPGDFSTLQKTSTGEYRRTFPDGREISYSATGYMYREKDRFGNALTLTYDAGGTRVLSVVDPAGLATTFNYNAAGHLASIVDPMGRQSIITRTDTTAWRVNGADGRQALNVRYAASRRIVGWTDARGGVWDVKFDTASRRVSQISAPAVVVGGTSARQVTNVVAREANLLPLAGTGTSSTNLGRRVLPPDAVRLVTDPRGQETRVWVDGFGKATTVSGPGGKLYIVRNSRGQVQSVSPDGIRATRYEYEATFPFRLRLVSRAELDGGDREAFEYGAFSQVSRATINETTEHRFLLDALGRTTHVLENGDTIAWLGHDAQGRLTSRKDARGNLTTWNYGSTGTQNLLSTTHAGVTTAFRYDAMGRSLTSVTSGIRSDSVGYDPLNRVTRVWERNGALTRLTFGNGVDVDTVIDARGQRYRFTRNILGMVVTEHDPANLAMHATLNPATLLPSSTTNRRNQTTTFQYDSLRRVTSRTADGQTTTWRYAADSTWMVVRNAVSTDSLVYDRDGKLVATYTQRGAVQLQLRTAHARPIHRPQPDTFHISGPWGTTNQRFRYNGRGQLSGIRDVSGAWTTLHYDKRGMLDSLRLPTSPVARSRFVVSEAYRIAAVLATAPDLSHWYTYSSRGLLLRDSLSAGSGGHHQYAYNAVDRVSQWDLHQIVPEQVCYTLRDCVWEKKDSVMQSMTFAWDSVGNPRGAPIAAGNRLLTHAGFSMLYDADGNLIRKLNTATGVRDTLTWNTLGQLTGVQRTGGLWVYYAYDGLGRRVRRTVQNSTAVIQYVYHDDDLLLELDGSGNRIREYSHLPGIDRPHSMRQWANGEGGKMYYYQLQAPGHVNGLVDVARTLVNHYRYTPFGTPANGYPVEGTPNPLQYMARELDATTGLYYVRNRWYDPQVGRFVSEDPIGLAGGMNKYEYVVGNPISYTDPSGLGCQWSIRVPVYPDNIMQNGISGWQQVASGTYSWCMMALFQMQSQNPDGVDWGIRGGVHPGGGGGGPGGHPGQFAPPRPQPDPEAVAARCSSGAFGRNIWQSVEQGAILGAGFGAAQGTAIGFLGGRVGGGLLGAVAAAPSGPLGSFLGASVGGLGGGFVGGAVGGVVGAGAGVMFGGVIGGIKGVGEQGFDCLLGKVRGW